MMANEVMYVGGIVQNGKNANCRLKADKDSDLRFHMAFGDKFTVTNSEPENGYVYGFPTDYASKGYAYILESCLQRTEPDMKWDTCSSALGDYTLQEGAFGRYVFNLQVGLEAAGYLTDSPDGMFGPKTKQAVIAFQSANKELAVDGLAGEKTKECLFDQQKDAIEDRGK